MPAILTTSLSGTPISAKSLLAQHSCYSKCWQLQQWKSGQMTMHLMRLCVTLMVASKLDPTPESHFRAGTPPQMGDAIAGQMGEAVAEASAAFESPFDQEDPAPPLVPPKQVARKREWINKIFTEVDTDHRSQPTAVPHSTLCCITAHAHIFCAHMHTQTSTMTQHSARIFCVRDMLKLFVQTTTFVASC